MGALAVTIDFLMPPAPGQDQARRVQPLQPDFGALVTPGLELAFEERVWVGLEGMTLTGERARQEIPVRGQAAFVVLKALTFADRAELKDAYDLCTSYDAPPDEVKRSPSGCGSTWPAIPTSLIGPWTFYPATSTPRTRSARNEPRTSCSMTRSNETATRPMPTASSTTCCAPTNGRSGNGRNRGCERAATASWQRTPMAILPTMIIR